ncbi:MAG: 50S ribosomal protein L3 [Deltaproteobacteria bacterium]|nr:50S ribosomal protein L3 [Deltaproteobacteria bacterium]
MTPKQYPEGLLGRKLGMTQVFTAEGECIPVTVLEAGPCFVLDVKTPEKHKYSAVQFGYQPQKTQRVDKAMMGHFKKAAQGAFYHTRELRCDVDTLGWKEGQEIKVGDVFMDGEKVDVTGTSIGRGFAGVVKKFKVKGQPSTRGTHEVRRHIGAIGCRKFPGRVFKNQKMPGHYGAKKATVQNLKVIAVRPEDNVILVKGAVPGPKNSLVVIRKSIKSYKGVNVPQPQQPTEEAAA